MFAVATTLELLSSRVVIQCLMLLSFCVQLIECAGAIHPCSSIKADSGL